MKPQKSKKFIPTLFLCSAIIACTSLDDHSQLKYYDLKNKDIPQFKLDKELKEISGITFNDKEQLFAHNDEEGMVFRLDVNTGEILKSFSLGKEIVKEDFEDITFANGQFYLVTSGGVIYQFKEGEDGETVDYNKIETSLKSKYDVEGLCFDPETNSLLLACKEFGGEGISKSRAVYSFNLSKLDHELEPRWGRHELELELRFIVSKRDLDGYIKFSDFNPSGIARHPGSGSFFLLTGKSSSIIELSKDGEIIGFRNLNKKTHNQPEGITFATDSALLIADEGGKGKATLSIYHKK